MRSRPTMLNHVWTDLDLQLPLSALSHCMGPARLAASFFDRLPLKKLNHQC